MIVSIYKIERDNNLIFFDLAGLYFEGSLNIGFDFKFIDKQKFLKNVS